MRKLLVGAAFALACSAAEAADIPARRAATAPAFVPAQTLTWTGWYIGGNAGYSWGRQSIDFTGAAVGSSSLDIDGFIGGGQIGYNWQAGNWVFGIEADIQGSGQDGSAAYTVLAGGAAVAVAETADLDWFGTVRGRLGWAAGPWLSYITGGWAYGKVSSAGTVTVAGVATAFSGSETRTDGWTLGAGFEYKFAQNWSFGVEYLYLNFGGESATAVIPTVGTFTATTSDFEDHIVRARLNFHF